MSQHYDLIAIGGGSGGIAGANRAASYGARCAVVEQARLGGTCVNVGCVPKKVMWAGAGIAEMLQHASGYGFDIVLNGFNWQTLKQRRDAYIERLNGIYAKNLTNNQVDQIVGHAQFKGPHEIEVDGQRFTADRFLIATGGVPSIPNIPGAELGITSDGFFELEQQPKKVAVVGAGYIAVELAGIFNALGSETSLLIRKDSVIRNFDAMLGTELMAAMDDQGIQVRSRTQPARLEKQASDLIDIHCEDGTVLKDFDCVLWAIGREPNTHNLGLDQAGLSIDPRGFIQTDDWQATEVEHIFAVGDVTGRAQLTPVAIAAARRLSDRLFGGMRDRKLDNDLIPSVVFSHPTIGTIGMSESEARERFGGSSVKVYQSRFTPMFYALTEHKQQTHMKLVVVGDEEKVVGCHLFGDASDEILQGFAVAMRMGACKRDLDDTMAIHPTSAEELVTMT